jgi:large subunit ribosomal protein L6
MSRLASKPITLESSVTVTVGENRVTVKGPKGSIDIPLTQGITVVVEGTEVRVDRENDLLKAFQGLAWSMIRNGVVGVTQGFSKKLSVVGKGWRSQVTGNKIILQVGHSHPDEFILPAGVTATQENPGNFTVSSFDKQLLGQVCANIKKIRPIEPYKLKGIRIEGQLIRQKERKTAGA